MSICASGRGFTVFTVCKIIAKIAHLQTSVSTNYSFFSLDSYYEKHVKVCANEYHSIFVMYCSSLYLIDMNSYCTYLCDNMNCSLTLQALHAVSISLFTNLVTLCDSFNSEIQASNN